MSEQTTQLATFRGIKYKKNWFNYGSTLTVIGLGIFIFYAFTGSGQPGRSIARLLSYSLGFGIIFIVYSLGPAMGQFMSGDQRWDDLSTVEQLIQLTKWSVIGGVIFILLLFGLALLVQLIAPIV